MKSFLLLLLTVFSLTVKGQNVTPYDDNNGSDPNNEFTNQITFFDYNYVSAKIQSFIQRRMSLSKYKGDAFVTSKNNEVILTSNFRQNGFNNGTKHLTFRYTLFPISHDLVIKSLIISGDIDLVIEFWAKFWNTSPKFNTSLSSLLVKNRFIQDEIAVYGGKIGKITVVNSSITDVEKFISDFKKRKEKSISVKYYDDTVAIARKSAVINREKDRLARLDSINKVRENEEKRLSSRQIKSFDIIIKKNNNGVIFQSDYPEKLKTAVTERLSSQKNGTFGVRVFEYYENGTIYQYSANVLDRK